jgi:ferritin-like metal-binding protein YciE
MSITSLLTLLKATIQRLYSGEYQLAGALPRIAEEVSSPELKEALNSYAGQTEQQLVRLESAASILRLPLSSTGHSGIEGLIRELKNIGDEQGAEGVIDLALVAALKRIEFCELSCYETARSLAEAVGEGEVLNLLDNNLREEEGMERFLTVLSEEFMDECSAYKARAELSE